MKKYIFIYFLLLTTGKLSSQESNLFDSIYNEGIDKASKNIKVSIENLKKLEGNKEISYIQQAKINYLKFKIACKKTGTKVPNYSINLTEINVKEINNTDTLLEKGINLIHNSYPDIGIPILFEFLERTKGDSIQKNKQYYCKINIAEGYRKKREFKKAINLLNSIIYRVDISKKNLVFAFSRLSANYSEWRGGNIESVIDTVIKYSELSVNISRENHYYSNLATSLNELGYIYSNKLYKYNIAEKYFIEALNIFIIEKSFKNAINTTINLSGLYLRKGNYRKALETAERAINICDIEGNEDAHMRLYLQLAKIYSYNKMYHSAYEFLTIGRNIQEKLNTNLTDKAINELAAKYDLEIKEELLNQKKK